MRKPRQRGDIQRPATEEQERGAEGADEFDEARGKKRRAAYKANYRGARPEQVAQAVLRYRPKGRK